MANFILRITLGVILAASLGSCQKQLQIYIVADPPSGDGPKSLESPQWSAQENALYWVSNMGEKMLFRLDVQTGEITNRTICHGSPSSILPVRDHPGYVVVAVRSSLFLLNWEAKDPEAGLRLLTTVDIGKPDNRINDAKVDPAGRLFFGTMPKLDLKLRSLVQPDQCAMYSISAATFTHPTIMKIPISLSNGMAWSLDTKKMYYNDSPTRRVVSFDYDLKKGTMANETTVFCLDKENIDGIVDGLTIDEDGNLWVATVTPILLKVNPKYGTILDAIELPVDNITSVMWGGPSLDQLFVTTAALRVKKPKPLSGALLALEGLETRGLPENLFVFPDAPNY